jgi:hypothetical protein
MFALNFSIVYLLEFLVLVGKKSDEGANRRR